MMRCSVRRSISARGWSVAERTVREIEVYGRRLLLERTGTGWLAYDPGADGKRQPAPDVRIPDFVRTDGEVKQFLGDLLHELATPDNQAIRWRP